MLRFLSDLRIPPTSNGAERDLRPAKTQQRISGRLRSEDVTRNRAGRYRMDPGYDSAYYEDLAGRLYGLVITFSDRLPVDQAQWLHHVIDVGE